MKKHCQFCVKSECYYSSIFSRISGSSVWELHPEVSVGFNIKYYNPEQCYGEFTVNTFHLHAQTDEK